MNKILIVGHTGSGCRDVEQLLVTCGMQQAKSSRNERLSPVEIGSILRKAHGYASVEDIDQSRELRQIEAGPVWNGLALDLLMNNIDQKFWGWSDPQAIVLLDYWKSMEPKLAFMLVYDEPHRVLAEMTCDEARQWTRELLEQRLENWNAYNSALLAFHLRNQDRSMLVNARQVRRNADACMTRLQSYLDKQLQVSAPSLEHGSFRAIPGRNGSSEVPENEGIPFSSKALTVPALADRFIIESIMSGYPEHVQRYEELQASATIPMEASSCGNLAPVDAWLTQMKRRSETGRVIMILAEQKQRIERKLIEQERADARTRELLAAENEQLLVQLLRLQEELERYYHEHQKYQKIGAEKSVLETRQKAVEAEKQHLEKKLKELQRQVGDLTQGSASSSRVNKELSEENELLLSQLHQVQEELERYYLENQRFRQEAKPSYYGAADRLKRELPYRLGAAMIEQSRKVWPVPFLPISLWRISRAYRTQVQQSAEKLPPLSEYRDYSEAAKAQKHLSYRLGETWLQHSRTPWGWIVLPFALVKARRVYCQYRQSLQK
jgi:hypothetical protein